MWEIRPKRVFDELKARGVREARFVCIDGLPGLEEGIASIFPMARVQRCMVHLVRGSLKYIPSKHYKTFCKDAKAIYGAPSLAAAADALEQLRAGWNKDYPAAVRVWTDHFEYVERLFDDRTRSPVAFAAIATIFSSIPGSHPV